MTSSFRTITLLPRQRIPTQGPSSPGFQADVSLLSPPSPRDVQKWNSALSKVKVWYVDGDGDEITVKTFGELVAGIRDLEEVGSHGFVFQYRATEDGLEIENELARLGEANNSNVDGFELTGDVEPVESGERSPLLLAGGANIGRNVSIDNEPTASSFEGFDMITRNSSPTPSSRAASVANDETS